MIGFLTGAYDRNGRLGHIPELEIGEDFKLVSFLPGVQLAIALANVINRALEDSFEFFDKRILASATALSARIQFRHHSCSQLLNICSVVFFSFDASSGSAR